MTTTIEIREIPLSRIYPNPDQPRKHFNQGKLEELSESIKEHGVQQPIKVAPRVVDTSHPAYSSDGPSFMIVMGERRYRASHLAGKETIPAIVEELTDDQVEALALLENLQRQDLNPIEEGRAYQRMLEKHTVEELARILGYKKTGPILDRTSLLNLRTEYQDMVVAGTLSTEQAFEMSRLAPEKQDHVFRKIKAGELATYNKLFAYVAALLTLERQEEIFALTPLSPEEQESINAFDGLVKSIERFIARVQEREKLRHLEKAVFHSDVSAEKVDYIITSLQKIRRTILAGEGVKEAMEEQAA